MGKALDKLRKLHQESNKMIITSIGDKMVSDGWPVELIEDIMKAAVKYHAVRDIMDEWLVSDAEHRGYLIQDLSETLDDIAYAKRVGMDEVLPWKPL